jgi:hypothetical protein
LEEPVRVEGGMRRILRQSWPSKSGIDVRHPAPLGGAVAYWAFRRPSAIDSKRRQALAGFASISFDWCGHLI